MIRIIPKVALLCLLGVIPLLSAEGPSRNPHQVGEVVLREVAILPGKVVIRVDSGGCTDKASITARVAQDPAPLGSKPRFTVTFQRVRPDDCKALLLEGVELEYDLTKDLKLPEGCLVAVANPVAKDPGVPKTADLALREALLQATRAAIALELKGYEDRLKAAQSGLGPASNVAHFQARVEEAKAMAARYRDMTPAQYPAPEDKPEADLPGGPAYGPVVPAQRLTIQVTPTFRYQPGSLLEAENTSRSGPFYHLAGGAYAQLKPGRTYDLTVYRVYKREYISFISDSYVYVAEVR